MKKEHLFSIDLIRIISFLAIAMVHVSIVEYENIGKISYIPWLVAMTLSFMMRFGTPMFVMISGYLLLNSSSLDNSKEFYKKRLKRVLIPLLFWNIFYYFLWSYLDNNKIGWEDFMVRFMAGGTYYHLYFMFLITGLYIISPGLKKIIQKVNLYWLVPILMLTSFGYLIWYSQFGGWQMHNAILWFIPYIGYYLAGYWLGRINIYETKRWWLWTALVLLTVGVIVNIYLIPVKGTGDEGTFMSNRLSITVAGAASLMFLYFIKIKNEWFVKKHWEKVTKIGELGMGLYLVHPLVIEIFKNFEPFKTLELQNPLVWIVIAYVGCIMITFGLVKFIKSVPWLREII